MISLLQQLEQSVCELSLQQKRILVTFLSDVINDNNSIDLLEHNLAASPECPHCHRDKIKRHGKINGRQRYQCKSCIRTFMCTTKTPFYRLRKPERWRSYFNCMIDSKTIRESASDCCINKKTSFLWRHRFLALPNKVKATSLSGIVEIDETLFRYSEKGSHTLSRRAHKRGKDQAGRGRAKGDWVPVLVARDRQKQTYDKCLTSESAQTLHELLNKRIAKDSVVCTDGFRSYSVLMKRMKLEHKILTFSKNERVKDKVFHIQNVNAYHSRLHLWMARFHGVATKYLPNYLGWFRFFESHRNANENNLLALQTQLTGT